ncbi:MAG TPA: hypothetical protein VGC18_14465 [Lacisediminihabitans sp.]|uniref:hypothetical protein n=1 Tax=Lacisediminihabitans sp. TaxID=2787631 RepID=UPI002EDAF136
MGLEGTYDLAVETPFGPQQAALTLSADGGAIGGRLQGSGWESELSDVEAQGHDVSFRARIKTPMGRIKAQIAATVTGDQLTGTATMPLGSARIRGTRRSADESRA